MKSDVDLRELAIERTGRGLPGIRSRRHLVTRYLIPAVLLCGFLSLVAWASRYVLFPPRAVTVVPVFSTTAEVRQEGTPLFKAAGWIEPRPTPVRVAALAPGVVEELLVVEDQPVAAGEPIARLIEADAKLTYERALADLELRKAELDESKATFTAAETRLRQPVHLEAALGEAEASLTKVETLLKNLPFELRRAEADHEAAQKEHESKMASKGVVAGVQIDVSKAKRAAAKAFVEELRDRSNSLANEQSALKQRRDALNTQLQLLADEIKAKDEAAARVRAATARVKQAEVVVAEAKLQLDRMTVRSPIAGRVYQLIAEPGTNLGGDNGKLASSDSRTVVTLYRPEMLQVRVDVRFEDIPKVSLNQPVQINNPALSSPLSGEVLFIGSEADIQKNTLQVKVEIPDPPSVFKPEMLVDVTFLAPHRERKTEPAQELRLYVLQQLIHREDGNPFIWLADQSDGVARKTRVKTGEVGSNGLVEILTGLSLSSRIIAGGSDGLKDGDRIRVTSEDPSLGISAGTSSGGGLRTINRLPTGEDR